MENVSNEVILAIEEQDEGGDDQILEMLDPKEIQEVEMTNTMEQLEISIHALNCSLGYWTMKVTGYHFKKPLHILIDTGSSHNFIDLALVQQLGCLIRSVLPKKVAASNGNDMQVLVGDGGLGVQWLLMLGDIKMNFKKLTMEFYYKGKKHCLRGVGSQVTASGAGKMAKFLGNQSQLYKIQVVLFMNSDAQWYAIETKEQPKTDARLLSLLVQFQSLFTELTQLPPSRGVFDHRIVLHHGTEPVNVVQNWPVPTTLKQLRGFFGLDGYYRKFIQGFGIITRPLTDLLKRDKFKWSNEAATAFETLKERLTQAPFLALHEVTKLFIMETNSSGTSIGVVLMKEAHPIAFISKALTPKHAAIIIPFDYTIEYRREVENKVADALSRVTRAELMSLVLYAATCDLFQAIIDS
ncbi:hypothetical protein FXO38_22765 [Capsicum annuum]|nr:hypothetical protein FXO38_22765 [Capsicum annuum]